MPLLITAVIVGAVSFPACALFAMGLLGDAHRVPHERLVFALIAFGFPAIVFGFFALLARGSSRAPRSS